jgi:myo-inositol-1(or 4)-monophosphatase
MNPTELSACLAAAQEAAQRGGAVLQSWRKRISVREKGRFDLVTEADLAAQEAVRSCLLTQFPDHAFLGEEGGSFGELEQPTWIVDPLDGTTNYVHQMPFYAVSIGLAVGQELLLGVIFDPSRPELFHAARGQGAWLNGERLQTTDTAGLHHALLSTGFPPDLTGQEHTLETWRHFSLRTRSLRRTGSTALNLAYVAAGRNDGFWTHHAFAWDAAAGVVLVREAGGQATRTDGSPYELNHQDVLCTNGPLHPIMLSELRHSAPRQ